MISVEFEALKQRLDRLDTPHLCDGSRKLRVFDSEIRPIGDTKLVGVAFTVESEGDLLAMLQGLRDAKAGEVLVVSSGGSHRALAGELFATEAIRRKLAGIVIDGACRDIFEVRKSGLPFFARAISPKAGTRVVAGRTQVPIACGNTVVTPGDIVVGDINGLVAFSSADAEEVLSLAEAVREKETLLLKKMSAGASLLDLLNLP